MATPKFICANWKLENTECKKTGGFTCKSCSLVLYCGASCQKSHWAAHKVDCKSPLGKPAWSPQWVLENRKPAFVQSGLGVSFGGGKYIWGNVPAFDILQLEVNEGDDYKRDLNLLFAASGDMRNVIQTIAQLPSSYKQSIKVTINDHDIDIVARNTIMLLIALILDDVDEAIDCMIHVWYSTLVRTSDLEILQQRIRPLIQDICQKINGKTPATRLGKTWTFGQRSLRLVLAKSSWDRLLLFVSVPEGLTAEKANQIRKGVVLAESRKDYRDRNLIFQSPSSRIAKNRYWGDGLLLPFGSPRDEFQVPNPTFFQTTDTWPLKDNADPLSGWSSKDVEDTSSGAATADVYGKLFYHLRAVLRAFISRLTSLQVSFQIFQGDASDLHDHCEGGSCDRIEISNIADRGYLGLPKVLEVMIPLLQRPQDNPHATLIVLFMNIVDVNLTDQDTMASIQDGPATKRLVKYLSLTGGSRLGSSDPKIIKMSMARDVVVTYDHIFDRALKDFPFTIVEKLIGTVVKEKNTIIEKWPFRLKLRPGQPGAQEEFDRLLRGGVSGKERYMEWKIVSTQALET